MTAAARARTVTSRWPAVAVKTDVKTGHDIAYVTRCDASGCAGAMAYYTRTSDPPGTWEGRGCAALGVTGTVQGRGLAISTAMLIILPRLPASGRIGVPAISPR